MKIRFTKVYELELIEYTTSDGTIDGKGVTSIDAAYADVTQRIVDQVNANLDTDKELVVLPIATAEHAIMIDKHEHMEDNVELEELGYEVVSAEWEVIDDTPELKNKIREYDDLD